MGRRRRKRRSWIWDPIAAWRRFKNKWSPVAIWRRFCNRLAKNPLVKLTGFVLGLFVGLYHFFQWIYEAIQPAPAYAGNVDPTNADEFYSSYAYKKWSTEVFVIQRVKHGQNFCVLCGKHYGPLHSDHIKPRSTHPHLALDPNNGQVLCEDHNLGKSNRYEQDWRSSA